jgi:hypothetical protein
MTAFLTRMPAGIVGEVNRVWAATIEAQVITPAGTTGAPTGYGVPMVVDATAGNVGNMRTLQAADTHVYGILARPYPTQSSAWPQDGFGGGSPPGLQGPCDILREGYISVLLSGSTAAVKGGQVYVWTAAPSGTHITGGWEAANPGGSGFAVDGCTFMGPADASGFTEISFNGRIP